MRPIGLSGLWPSCPHPHLLCYIGSFWIIFFFLSLIFKKEFAEVWLTHTNMFIANELSGDRKCSWSYNHSLCQEQIYLHSLSCVYVCACVRANVKRFLLLPTLAFWDRLSHWTRSLSFRLAGRRALESACLDPQHWVYKCAPQTFTRVLGSELSSSSVQASTLPTGPSPEPSFNFLTGMSLNEVLPRI